MQAVVCHALGDPSAIRLEEVPSPALGDGDVRIAVRAAGVNFPDVLMIQGKYQEKPGLPVAVITAFGNMDTAITALKAGAFDFVQKPFRDQELMDRVKQALTFNEENQEETLQKKHVAENYATLTPRESEVMECVVKGQANKVIAMDLEVSQRTVEIHRARVMEKMQARSLAELVRMSMLLEE